jgi:hypothetical protein
MLLRPHPNIILPYVKYCLNELIMIDVEINLYTSSVVEKLQLKASTTPSLVFFYICLIIYEKKKSHSFYIFNDSSILFAN